MKLLMQIMSAVGLALTVGPSFFVFSGDITWDTHHVLMIIGTVLWFISAPYRMKTKDEVA